MVAFAVRPDEDSELRRPMSLFWPFGSDRRQPAGAEGYASRRIRMVESQLWGRGLADEGVLGAMAEVPRHCFVPPEYEAAAYSDQALPIGYGQTISQPYIVALMTAALRPRRGLRALEVGTGSGYQAAVLAACGLEVYTIERIPELQRWARENLARAGFLDRVHLRLGDGSRGWPEEAPFDRILLTAAAERLPPALAEHLTEGGILVAPVGDPFLQTIYRYRKEGGRLEGEALEGARFVPLVEGSEANGAGLERPEAGPEEAEAGPEEAEGGP